MSNNDISWKQVEILYNKYLDEHKTYKGRPIQARKLRLDGFDLVKEKIKEYYPDIWNNPLLLLNYNKNEVLEKFSFRSAGYKQSLRDIWKILEFVKDKVN